MNGPRPHWSGPTRAGALLASLALIALACPGCTDTHALDGTSWRLAGWSERSIDPREFTITAQFDEGRISGTSAVNSYGGEYSTGTGGAFSVGVVAQTLMAGPEPAMEAEDAYHKLLSGAGSYRLDGTTLTLFDADGSESLVFDAAAE